MSVCVIMLIVLFLVFFPEVAVMLCRLVFYFLLIVAGSFGASYFIYVVAPTPITGLVVIWLLILAVVCGPWAWRRFSAWR